MVIDKRKNDMWFLIVLMTMTPNDITPMWVLSTEIFTNQTSCTEYAVINQDILFQKAIEAHEYKIQPTIITCVPAEGMEQIIKESLEYGRKE